jgi:hypothetical protein
MQRAGRGAHARARAMSIMSAYRSGGFAERATAVRRLLERAPAPAARAPALGAGAGAGPTSAPVPAPAAATTAVVPAAPPAPAPAPPRAQVMAQVLADLAKRGALHRATMQAIEATEEWQGYDGQVMFELMLLRHRYTSTDTAMTAARRAQMQAHLRQKQLAVMEEHAERLADRFVASMTAAERDAFRAEFLRLDASPHVVAGATPRAPSVSMEQMQAALTDVTSRVRDPAFVAQWDTAMHHLSRADLAGGGGGGGSGGAQRAEPDGTTDTRGT